jgi:hypothetical protein
MAFASSSTSFSSLQHLLQLSYSESPEEQQRAAVDLARLVETTSFPAVSFGPLAHALCRLVPSTNRTVASYSARALKLLLLDDSLRPQAGSAGVPAIVCSAIKQWEDEILCLRELLGALQTLCWDKQCVRGVLQADIVAHLITYVQASDQEVSVLALATLANILVYCDTLLLADTVVIEALGQGMPVLLEALRVSHQRPQRFYAAAAVANAAAHPRLAALLNASGGLQLCREVETQSFANLHILGSKIGDCAQTAIQKLGGGSAVVGGGSGSGKRHESSRRGTEKFSFKWGTKPVMELSLMSYQQYGNTMWLCFAVWLLIVFLTLSPVLF